jgi:hypothetical protein
MNAIHARSQLRYWPTRRTPYCTVQPCPSQTGCSLPITSATRQSEPSNGDRHAHAHRPGGELATRQRWKARVVGKVLFGKCSGWALRMQSARTPFAVGRDIDGGRTINGPRLGSLPAPYGKLSSQALWPCVAAYSLRADGTIVSPATSTLGMPGAARPQLELPASSRKTPKSLAA